MSNDCSGCKYDKKHPSMKEIMAHCNYCKRAYPEAESDYHLDAYESAESEVSGNEYDS